MRRLPMLLVLCFLGTATVAWAGMVPAIAPFARTSPGRHSSTRGPTSSGLVDATRATRRVDAATPTRPALLMGATTVGSSVPASRAGGAQAFRFAEKNAGAALAITVYVRASSTSKTLMAGLYTDSAAEPHSMLAWGRASVRKRGGWVTVSIRRTVLKQGHAYWIALLGKRGRLAVGGRRGASCRGVTEQQAGLAALPRLWATGAPLKLCVAAYVSGRDITQNPGSAVSAGVPPPADASPPAGGTTTTGGSTPPATLVPADTVLPAVAGTAQQGHTLTASDGLWSNDPSSYAYQWQDCFLTTCSDIVNATAPSYTLQSSDVGETVDVLVTASNAAGSTNATSLPTALILPLAPVNTAAPTISGTAQQGDTLTASKGSWSNSPSSYGYQWQHCSSSSSCSNISGATGSSYTLQASDVGDTIDVVVTATNIGGSRSATSAQTGSVQAPPPAAPVNTAVPTIGGTAQQGDTLLASRGSWSNSPSSYAYQWQDCSSSTSCAIISGATSSSYTLQSSDVGYTIDVIVTASNTAGSGSATSAQTGSVQAVSSGGGAGSPVVTAVPAVTGNVIVGDAVTASSGSWSNSPSSYGYQWQDCVGSSCSSISGATGSSYTVQSSDVGHSLAVVVTATNSSGSNGAGSFDTAAVLPSTIGAGNFVSAIDLLGFAPPSGCSSLTATCIQTTNPPPWGGITEATVFALYGESPAQDATTTGVVSGSITSIPASVTATIPAGPIMLTTSTSNPSGGSYQILQTSGAASGATSIPVTGSPVANATYGVGSYVMVQGLNSSKNSIPTGSTLTSLTAAIHAEGAKAIVALGGSNDDNWGSDCVNGFQYLLGAEMANYMTSNGFDGVEIDDEDGSELNSSDAPPCWNGMAEEVHSVATASNQVPVVYVDLNPTDTSVSLATPAKAQVDQWVLEYFGYNPDNDYNCANSCSELGGYLSDAVSSGVPAQRWLSSQGLNGPYSQGTLDTLATTASVVSGAVTSIPVSALSAAMPKGAFEVASTSSPQTSYEILETSGAAQGATSIPVTGYCSEPGFTYGSGNCTTSSSVTLNGSYASGSDVYANSMGYSAPSDEYYGGWDCGNNAAYAAANNMLGVLEWYYDGTTNSKICLDQIKPFATGGLG
jgi:hypothetical protein